jgi:hypothetical protein
LVPFAPEYRCVRLFLETMTLLRIKLVAIESNLEFIMGQLARVPTRKQLARYSSIVMVGPACLVQTLAFLFR